MESAAALAKELGLWNEVSDFYAELQNYTVNVEGHNLHRMPLQRVPVTAKTNQMIMWTLRQRIPTKLSL
jgi:hypothetical protein